MGGEAKTCQTDDFKAMETEMGVRHEGTLTPDGIPREKGPC